MNQSVIVLKDTVSSIIILQIILFSLKKIYKKKVMAKVEGNKENWHGHVTCLSVAPEFRRQGASKELMNVFEKTSEM
jgi:ribosomal protein S18 acetylase RimI-like enzyme